MASSRSVSATYLLLLDPGAFPLLRGEGGAVNTLDSGCSYEGPRGT
jgi:hypothetical protein